MVVNCCDLEKENCNVLKLQKYLRELELTKN